MTNATRDRAAALAAKAARIQDPEHLKVLRRVRASLERSRKVLASDREERLQEEDS